MIRVLCACRMKFGWKEEGEELLKEENEMVSGYVSRHVTLD